MNIVRTLTQALEGIHRRATRETHIVNVIDDEALRAVLDQHGLLAPLEAGALRCPITAEVLTWESVGGLLVVDGVPTPASLRGLLERQAQESRANYVAQSPIRE
jgi:hypothetical protein